MAGPNVYALLLVAVVSLSEGRRVQPHGDESNWNTRVAELSNRGTDGESSLTRPSVLLAADASPAFAGPLPVKRAPVAHGVTKAQQDAAPTRAHAPVMDEDDDDDGNPLQSFWNKIQGAFKGEDEETRKAREEKEAEERKKREEEKARAQKERKQETAKKPLQKLYDANQDASRKLANIKDELEQAQNKQKELQKQLDEQAILAAKLENDTANSESEVAKITQELTAKLNETGFKIEDFVRQDFLEFTPYFDKKEMPNNLFKPKDPFTATIRSVKRIVGENATGETCDIVIDHGGDMPYVEGQSYGVIPPGTDAKGKPNKVRLYSIASSRYGDDMTGKTTTLCVRRATYWCPEMRAEDPAKKGVCSNYLCDANAGDMVKLTGPTGKVMLLPEDKPETDIIMVATGTGIAPMRSFLRRMFTERTPYKEDFKGLAWLFLGVANADSLLYDDEWKTIKRKHPKQFRYDVALSREQTKADGSKVYIQDRVEEYGDEIFNRLKKGAHIYFCGLKGMMPGIQDMLKRVAEKKKLDYDEFIKELKKNGQWHVEVY